MSPPTRYTRTWQNKYVHGATPLSPNGPYSTSKTSADLFVRAYHETFDLPVNITRCSSNYGPYQFPEKLILTELRKPESLIQHVADRPDHDQWYAIDNTKITTELGWKPVYTFEEGMAVSTSQIDQASTKWR